jgi:FtsH-binding integral membrane protein
VRLYAKRLVQLGFPTQSSSIAWYTAISLLTLLVAAGGLRLIETRTHLANSARHAYVTACAAGAAGTLVLAATRRVEVAIAAVVAIGATAANLARTTGTIWLNQRTSSEIRATVHSLRAQGADLGEITCSLALGIIAQRNLGAAFWGAATLLGIAALLAARGRKPAPASG